MVQSGVMVPLGQRTRICTTRANFGKCVAGVLLALCACSSNSRSNDISANPGSGGALCTSTPGSPLIGAAYNVAKSRFAFGSSPVPLDAGAITRWSGVDGALAIWRDGSEEALLDANAPQRELSGWAGDAEALDAHVVEYFESMGIEACQIAGVGQSAGIVEIVPVNDKDATVVDLPATVELQRGVAGVSVVESLASAEFDSEGQTTHETFYWPEIPADVLAAAMALQAQTATPAGLMAYRAKLPPDAQGPGHVVIHHTVAGSELPFSAVAVYDATASVAGAEGPELVFDINGDPVTPTWE